MASKIFISYRRDDEPAFAARVRDGLTQKFGRGSVFMDVDELLAGQRFDQELTKALSTCDVLIAIIGRRWMDQLRQRLEAGERDYVREEIAEAIKRGILVVPARVGREGAIVPLPRQQDLPEDIQELVLYQKHDVTHEQFKRDIAGLTDAITTVRRTKRPQYATGRRSGGLIAASLVALLAAGSVGVHYSGIEVPVLSERLGPDKADEARNRQEAEETERKRLAALEAERQRAAAVEEKRKAEEEARKQAELTRPGRVFRDCPACPEMVVVPAGSFTMGSPESEAGRDKDEVPQRRVTIGKPFAVAKYEVTVDQFEAFVTASGHKVSNRCYQWSDSKWEEKSGSFRNPGFEQSGKSPAACLSWQDASAYVAWLSKTTGETYRLLSEAEWEYAARAGTTTPFSTGETINTTQANYDGNFAYGSGSKGTFRQRTVPVGSFRANAFGLHDTHGNVWEWVEDCYKDSYQGAPTDGSPVTSSNCSLRVLRGGSWVSVPRTLRSAVRGRLRPDSRGLYIGFRLARTL